MKQTGTVSLPPLKFFRLHTRIKVVGNAGNRCVKLYDVQRVTLFSVAILGLLLLAPAMLKAQCVVENRGAPRITGAAYSEVGQSFTPTCSGELSSMVIRVEAEAQQVSVRILNGDGLTGTVLYGPVNVTLTGEITSDGTTLLGVVPNIPVTAGNIITMAVTKTPGLIMNFPSSSNRYASGKTWWNSSAAGVQSDDIIDLHFRATINPPCVPPSINSQPLASQTLCSTDIPANLSFGATGTGLKYQWYSNVLHSNAGGTTIGGATLSTVTPSTTVSGTNYYYAVVSGTCGVDTTEVAEVNLGEAIVTTATPSTICPGQTVTLSAGATGFSGSFAPSKWTVVNGTADFSNAPNYLLMDRTGNPGTSTVESPALPESGMLTFHWYLIGDPGSASNALFYFNNGQWNKIILNQLTSFQGGFITIPVTKGEKIGFSITKGQNLTSLSYFEIVSAPLANIDWYTAPAGGTAFSTLASPVVTPTTTPGVVNYYASTLCNGNIRTPVTITVKEPAGIASATAETNPLFAGTTTTLTANGVKGTNALVTWRTGPNGTGNQLGTGETLQYAGPGTYYARVTADCGNPVEASVTVTVSATALHFDGGNDYVFSNNDITIINAAPRTIEFWAKVDANAGSQFSFFHWGPLNFGGAGQTFGLISVNRSLKFMGWGAGDLDANYTINDDWHHYAVSYDGTNVTVYVDGVSVASGQRTLQTAQSALSIGRWPNGNLPFAGTMDEFRIWNRALCAIEIQNNMNCQLGNAPTGLAVYYKFNQGIIDGDNSAVNTLTDGSGNNNTATLDQFALTGSTSNWTTGIVGSGTCAAFSALSVATNPSGTATYCVGGSITLTANSVNATSPAYQWYKDGTAISGATGVTYTVTEKGSYTVSVTSSGCSALSLPTMVRQNTSMVRATATPPAVCPGQSANLMALSGGFAGTYAPANWSYSGSGSLDTSTAPDLIQVVRNSPSEYIMEYASMPASGPLEFYWYMNNTDDLYYWSNGQWVSIQKNPLLNAQGGVVTVQVVKGQKFAFRINRPLNSFSTSTISFQILSAPETNVEWYNAASGGTAFSTDATPAITPATVGIHNFYAGVPGCTSGQRTLVAVTVKEAAEIASATAANSPVCTGTATTLTANGIKGTNAIVTWRTAANGTGNQLGTGATLPNAGAGTYYARVTADCGNPVEASVTVEAFPEAIYYRDNDNDTYGNANDSIHRCTASAPAGYVADNTDCNDNNNLIHSTPATPAASANTPVCLGNTINLSTPAVSGATYSWSGPNGYTSSVRNPSIPGATDASAGNYSVAITVNGCTSSTGSTTLSVTTVSATAVKTDATAGNTATGTITATASGGTDAYQYKLNSTGVYQPSEVFNNLYAGTYRIYLKDAKGCTGFTNAVTITEPAPVFTTSVAKTDVTCFGSADGTMTATVTGGYTPYQYKNGSLGTTYQFSNIFSNLAPGTYRIYFKDAKGYTGYVDAVTIKQSATALTATFTKVDATCIGSTNGAFTITTTGGTGPYTYTNASTGNAYASNVVSGLAPGTYPVNVADTKGCIIPLTIVIGPAPFISTVLKTDATVYGASDGTTTLNLSGGTPPYQFKNGSTGTYQDNNMFTGLAAGTYRIYYKDARGCWSCGNAVTITQPNPVFTSQATATNVTCNGAADGSITANVSTGGTGPYQYKNGSAGTVYQPSGVFSNLAPGTYRIYFKDAKNFTGYTNAVTIANSPTVCGPALVSGAGNSKVKANAGRGIPVEVKKDLEVILSPNPSSTSFKILAHGKADKAVHVRVLDMNGRVVYAAEGGTEQAFKFGQLFTSGVYLVEVRQGEEVETVKAVKVR